MYLSPGQAFLKIFLLYWFLDYSLKKSQKSNKYWFDKYLRLGSKRFKPSILLSYISAQFIKELLHFIIISLSNYMSHIS